MTSRNKVRSVGTRARITPTKSAEPEQIARTSKPRLRALLVATALGSISCASSFKRVAQGDLAGHAIPTICAAVGVSNEGGGGTHPGLNEIRAQMAGFRAHEETLLRDTLTDALWMALVAAEGEEPAERSETEEALASCEDAMKAVDGALKSGDAPDTAKGSGGGPELSNRCDRDLAGLRDVERYVQVLSSRQKISTDQNRVAKLWRAYESMGGVHDILVASEARENFPLAEQLDFSEYAVLASIYLANDLDEYVDYVTSSLPWGRGVARFGLSLLVGQLMGRFSFQIIEAAEGSGLPVNALDATRAACKHYGTGQTRPGTTTRMLRGSILRWDPNAEITKAAPECPSGQCERIAKELAKLMKGSDSSEVKVHESRYFSPPQMASRDDRGRTRAANRILDAASSCRTVGDCTLGELNAQVSIGLAVEAAGEVAGDELAADTALRFHAYDTGAQTCCRGTPLPIRDVREPVTLFLLDRSGSMRTGFDGNVSASSKWDVLRNLVGSILEPGQPTGRRKRTMIREFYAPRASKRKLASCDAYDTVKDSALHSGSTGRTAVSVEAVANTDTPTGPGLLAAAGDLRGEARGSAIVLVTDGIPDCSESDRQPHDGARTLQAASDAHSMDGNRVYAIGIGRQFTCDGMASAGPGAAMVILPGAQAGSTIRVNPREFLDKVAEAGGTGRAYFGSEADTLEAVFQRVVEAQECTVPWHPDSGRAESAAFVFEAPDGLPGRTYFRISTDDECSDFGVAPRPDHADKDRADEDHADKDHAAPSGADESPGATAAACQPLESPVVEHGWKYCSTTGQVRFYGQACEDYRAGQVPVPSF